MNDGQSPTNELEAIEGIVEDTTADLAPKIGIVKLIDDPARGIVSLHVPGETDESRPDEWFTASPGNRLYSAVLPEIDDRVEFTCQDANGISNYRWHFLDRYESENGGAGKAVIHEREDQKIMWDISAKKLELTAGDCELVMDENGEKIEVKRPDCSLVLDETARKAELEYGAIKVTLDNLLNKAVMSNGTNRIEITAAGVDIYGTVTFKGPAIFDGGAAGPAGSPLTITSNVDINGNLEAEVIHANNNITITGLPTPLKTHTHAAGEPPGDTGPPK
jgi:hypothetical protein